jgi:hypothetical protein
MARHRVRDEQRVEEWQEGVTSGGSHIRPRPVMG